MQMNNNTCWQSSLIVNYIVWQSSLLIYELKKQEMKSSFWFRSNENWKIKSKQKRVQHNIRPHNLISSCPV